LQSIKDREKKQTAQMPKTNKQKHTIMKNENTTQASRTAQIINTTRNPRSAWAKGVRAYALELLESYEPNEVTKQGLLNGAAGWSEYSYGGNAHIFDQDIAEGLCTPSGLKAKRGGDLQPNSRTTWLDLQARALGQACNMILDAAKLA
jgi:hypothetical protein